MPIDIQRRFAKTQLQESARRQKEVLKNRQIRDDFLAEVYRLSPAVYDQLFDKYNGNGRSMITDLRENSPSLFNNAHFAWKMKNA